RRPCRPWILDDLLEQRLLRGSAVSMGIPFGEAVRSQRTRDEIRIHRCEYALSRQDASTHEVNGRLRRKKRLRRYYRVVRPPYLRDVDALHEQQPRRYGAQDKSSQSRVCGLLIGANQG